MINKKKPRPHQVAQISAAIAHFETQNRGTLISACGTGKTLTALWIAGALEAKSLIIGVPSLALQDQYCMSFIAELKSEGEDNDILLIGSDYSMEKSHGVQVTTNIEAIVAFLLKKSNKKTIFTTYQSTPQLFSAAKLTGFEADFCIIDEAHRTAGAEFTLFSGILSDENLKCKKRLFMTATPRFFRGEEMMSMDDPTTYGDVIYRLDTDTAIAQGILCDYKVVVLYCTDKVIRNSFIGGRFRSAGNIVATSRYFAMAAALKNAIEKYKLKRIVTFHKNIKVAKIMTDIVNDIYPPEYEGFHVNHTNSINSRREILSAMQRATIGIVTNAKALGEGWDMPECDAVVFVDAKKSSFETVQSIGRALRRHESKERGYVIIPIMVSEAGIVNPDDFDNLRIALTTIGTMDRRVRGYLKKSAAGQPVLSENIEIMRDASLPPAIDTQDLMDKISLRIWDRLKLTEWKPFEALRAWAIAVLKAKGIETKQSYVQHIRSTPSLSVDIPITPELVYAEWQGWEHFFDKREKNDLFSYEEAKVVLRDVQIINTLPKYLKWKRGEIQNIIPFPERLPASPAKTYASEWKGYDDYFGYEKTSHTQMTYSESLKWVAENLLPLGIDGRAKFYEWLRSKTLPARPAGFSSRPEKLYSAEWEGWDAFFGKKKSKNVNYWDYETAKKWVEKELLIPFGIDSFGKWHKYLRGEYPNAPQKPEKIPADLTNLGGWQGYSLFFEKTKYFRNWYTFSEAREVSHVVAKQGIDTPTKWKLWQMRKVHIDIPYPDRMPKGTLPYRFYRTEWRGWDDFLGLI